MKVPDRSELGLDAASLYGSLAKALAREGLPNRLHWRRRLTIVRNLLVVLDRL